MAGLNVGVSRGSLMADHLERIGQIVGDYRLLNWLGGGGFGHVYLAEPIHGGSQVAIKILQIRLTERDDLRTFLNEARTMRLKHPHIIPLLDFGLSYEDTPFLVMEYAANGTLRQRHPKGTRVPLHIAVTYAIQMASALQYAHDAHVIHRDVKSANMLLRADNTLLLSDFGIATTAYSTNSLNATREVGGTVPYMAPEQLRGKPRPQTDQYALAVVVYEWLTGYCPFQGTVVEIVLQHTTKAPPSLCEQVPTVPREVEEVLFKALAKDPQQRFASIQAFADALQQTSQMQTSSISTIIPVLQQPPAFTRVLDVSEPTTKSSPLPAILAVNTPPAVNEPTLVNQHQPVASPLIDHTHSAQQVTRIIPPVPTQPLPPLTSPLLPNTGQIQSGVKKSRFLKWRLLLLAVIVLGLIGSGGFAYTNMETTAAMQAKYKATAMAISQSTATVIDARNAYIKAVSHGIMFGFDAQHTHYNPYEHMLSAANISRLQLRWTASTSGHIITSSPVAANGMVYIGSEDKNLYAFDAYTGQQVWTAQTGGRIYSSPAVANNVVYVGSNDGNLYAFNATSGKVLWTTDTGNAIKSSPVAANGLVYVGSEDHTLHAFDARTGQQKWALSTGGSIDSSPAVADGMVFVGSQDHKLYAADAATGQQQWAVSTDATIAFSSPAVANGIVYIGSQDRKLYAFNAYTGDPQWDATTTGLIDSSPAVANGTVYVGSYNGYLYAFDAYTGQLKWASPAGGVVDTSSPTVANGLVYIGSWDDRLCAFDTITGEQRWASPPTGDYIYSSPAVANGIVYIGSYDGKLYAFSL
jgi:outer membrane protein assembly factor BamB/serine/threonine protein kinase